MKLLFIADFHNQFELMPELDRKASEADIIIDAGDPTIFEHELQRILVEYNKWKKPVLMIHGNHEDENSLRNACRQFRFIEFFHGEKKIVKGITFLGWGGGGFSLNDPEFEMKCKEWSNQQLRQPLVLVTHAPPYKTALDDLGYPVGNKSIKKAIKKLKPIIAVSGHIHECEYREDKIGATRIINPGPAGTIVEIN